MSGLTTIKEADFVGRLTERVLVYYVITSVIAFSIANRCDGRAAAR
jgi:hypothetical protein